MSVGCSSTKPAAISMNVTEGFITKLLKMFSFIDVDNSSFHYFGFIVSQGHYSPSEPLLRSLSKILNLPT
jgi:hypothetical protein